MSKIKLLFNVDAGWTTTIELMGRHVGPYGFGPNAVCGLLTSTKYFTCATGDKEPLLCGLVGYTGEP